MRNVQVVSTVLAALLSSAGMIATMSAAHAVTMQEAGIGVGSTNDALFAIESNRVSIVERILSNFDGQIKAGANNASSVRASLLGLRADQLLSASLSNSLPDVMQILAEPVAVGPATHRYVAIAPAAAASYALPEAASSFVVRNNDDLSLAGRGDLTTAAIGSTVVGYFVPNVASGAVSVSNSTGVTSLRKDGVGIGTGSWIGFTAGGNAATGANSGVAAGTSNQATGAGSFVGAGVANQANGTSSLVLGGFDNRATNIDSLVGAGAGNRSTGARSVIVGGGYNLAAGNFSFIGGGGRDGVGSTAAGTDLNRDHRAFGKWSVIGGGTGNVTGVSGSGDSVRSSTVAGGARNTASGAQAFIGGGGCNVASGQSAVVVGGGQTSDTGACTFGNTASGLYSFVGGGYANTAAGASSVAMGEGAVANDNNSFVWASIYGTAAPANGPGSFNISAPSGLNLAANTSLKFGSQTRQMIELYGGANAYGIGVQFGTAYNRVDGSASNNTSGFGWYSGGIHSDAAFDPGAGGKTIMSVSRDGQLALPQVLQQQILLNNQSFQSFLGAGIGAQNYTTYSRFPDQGSFGFYKGGVHAAGEADPGTGGEILAGIYKAGNFSFMEGRTMTGTVRAAVFTVASDRALKTAFASIDAKSILAKVVAMPITSWVYIHDGVNAVRHIGPMAQDFASAFKVGYDDKTIATVDADGVTFAAIKGLNQLLTEKDAKITKIAKILSDKDAQIANLQREMNAIKKKLGM